MRTLTNGSREYDSYVDSQGNEYLYDEFLGKWIQKIKDKRASNPKVIARRQKRDERRIEKGKDPKFPELMEQSAAPVSAAVESVFDQPMSGLPPMTRQEAQTHKNVNKAVQEELKTKQEELKTLGLEKKVAQEDLKADKENNLNSLLSAAKGLIWVVAIVGGVVVLKKVFDAKPKGA